MKSMRNNSKSILNIPVFEPTNILNKLARLETLYIRFWILDSCLLDLSISVFLTLELLLEPSGIRAYYRLFSRADEEIIFAQGPFRE
jgi:hypothetical protein